MHIHPYAFSSYISVEHVWKMVGDYSSVYGKSDLILKYIVIEIFEFKYYKKPNGKETFFRHISKNKINQSKF